MKLRRATPADAAVVGRIHVESWNVAYRGIMPDDVIARTDLAYRTAFWQERLADPDWPIFLLEDDGADVAFCHMIATKDRDDDPTRVGHITSLHVIPARRGRGHGKTLMDHVLAEFLRRGYVEVTLWVLEENRAARAFYERYGFRPDGGRQHYRGTMVPEIRYRIRLSNPRPPE
jgi:ribosomal protein S18 acetylase RimI-like enzyme